MNFKKMIFLPVFCTTIISITGCSNAPEADFVLTCDVKFAKNADYSDFYHDRIFNINEYVFAYVDYTIKKASEKETEKIAFTVEVPYAEYYADASFFDGNVEPTSETLKEYDDEGNLFLVKYLKCRAITFDDKEVHNFKYIFAIKGNSKCENAEFKCRFIPSNTNLTTSMNGTEKENCYTVSYSFTEEAK